MGTADGKYILHIENEKCEKFKLVSVTYSGECRLSAAEYTAIPLFILSPWAK
jgi:hypothetical protein